MKAFKIPILILLAVGLLAAPCYSGEQIRRDANGDKWVVDTRTAGTPGAGAGLGALVAAVTDTLPAVDRHKFDIQIGLTALGVPGDDSLGTETAVTALTLYYRPKTFFRIGPRIGWDLGDNTKVSLGIPMGLKLNADAWDAYNLWLALNVLPTFTIRTGEFGSIRSSAWTYVPSAELRGEIPMGSLSLEGGLGLNTALLLEGVSSPAANDAIKKLGYQAELALNYRWRN